MTWALWRTSTAVRLSPAVAVVSTLATSRRQLGDAYVLDRLLELNLFVLVFGAGLAAALAAAEAGAVRRRGGLQQVRRSSARGTATILASDALPTFTAMVGAYAATLVGLCLTSDRGSYGWGEAALSVSVVVGIGLAVAGGQLLGWMLPGHLSPIVAGALPYVVYFSTALSSGAPWAVRALTFDEVWAPAVVPDGPRVLLAAGSTAAASVLLFLATTMVVRPGWWRWLGAAATLLAGLLVVLAVMPPGTKDAYYATVSDRPPLCASAGRVTVCVLATDGDLLPVLTAGVMRYVDANGAIPGAPTAVFEVGTPSEPGTWNVGSDALLRGSDHVVRELAAQHVSPTTDCPTEPPAPDGMNAPWSWLVADLLTRQAGAEPEMPIPRALAAMNKDEARIWLMRATVQLRSCRPPAMP